MSNSEKLLKKMNKIYGERFILLTKYRGRFKNVLIEHKKCRSKTKINSGKLLKGNFKDSLLQFKNQMQNLANEMHFEEAQKIKEKIAVLENYQAKSTVVNPSITNVDVFSMRVFGCGLV